MNHSEVLLVVAVVSRLRKGEFSWKLSYYWYDSIAPGMLSRRKLSYLPCRSFNRTEKTRESAGQKTRKTEP